MRIIIPAAGYATRLWPLTKETPKPLLPVGDKPIMEHIIDNVLTIPDVTSISVVTNHKFIGVFKEWAANFSCKVPVEVFDDGTTSNDDRLGQIGDIQYVLDRIPNDEDILVVAGDNLFNFKLSDINDYFKEKKAIVNPLFDAKSVKVAQEQGTVVQDKDGKFIEFMEKSPTPKTTTVSLGVYFMPQERVALIKDYLTEKPDMADKMGYFMAWLIERGEPIYGPVLEKAYFDVGWKEALDKARSEYKGFS